MTQLVLSGKLSVVMEVAHAVLGGHPSTAKVQGKVLSNFYCPGIHDGVTRYCQSCDTCQQMALKGNNGNIP